MVEAVTTLLRKLSPDRTPYAKISRISTHQALLNFNKHLKWLVSQHVTKEYKHEYLICWCFAKSKIFKNDAEVTAYCKVHLVVAAQQFEQLLADISDQNGKITNKQFKKYSTIIREYIFDLREIAEFLQHKKDKEYVFFKGGKSYGVMSWQVFRLSCQLAIQSAFTGVKSPIEHRPAQIASIFVLRQALEIKFDKLIGVVCYDKNGQSPHIKHDFKYEFIKKHDKFFNFNAVNFKHLKAVYDWSSEIVHGVYQPLAWQIAYAHNLCRGLFWSIETPPNQGWSIHNAVDIVCVNDMQSSYVDYFLERYDHGIWCILTREPEAVLR